MVIRFVEKTPQPAPTKSVDKKPVDNKQTPPSEKLAMAKKALQPDQRADEFFGKPKKRGAKSKEAISIRLDPDVLEYFRSTGHGWQGRIQEILRNHMKEAK